MRGLQGKTVIVTGGGGAIGGAICRRFADYGASLNSDKGDVFSSVRRTMDRFELRHHPKGGNVVTVSKKAR